MIIDIYLSLSIINHTQLQKSKLNQAKKKISIYLLRMHINVL